MAAVSKKHGTGLFVCILIAIAFGVVLGLVLPDFGVRMLKTFNVLFAQILKFIVPLHDGCRRTTPFYAMLFGRPAVHYARCVQRDSYARIYYR